MKKLGILLGLVACSVMTGCRSKVSPDSPKDSGYAKITDSWGIPRFWTTTGGFNGSPSNMNGQGPYEVQSSEAKK